MFNIQDFGRITTNGMGVAPSLWAYGTADNFATASGSGYFNAIASNLDIGDWIYIKSSDSQLAVHVTAVSPAVTVQVVSNYNGALQEDYIFVGNSSNLATAVAMSGDVHIESAGTTVIQKVIDGNRAANVPNGLISGGMPVLFPIAITGGATANYDIIVSNKIRVIDFWVQFNAAGDTSDTIQLFNGASAITNAMDGDQVDQAILRCGSINDATQVINASGTLRVTQTDSSGNNAPACTAYVLAINSA